ncbi:MAG: septum formation initiator family protein [Coriobacteriales bacterium]|jgi:cell division protein FtsB|nr:septum formation initiator family protein [Coriobacteriales bacterium]
MASSSRESKASTADRPVKRKASSSPAKAASAAGREQGSARVPAAAKSPGSGKSAGGKAAAGNRAGRIFMAVTLSLLGLLACLALAAAMLYPVAREYYLALRENQRLNAEYQAVLERNDRITEEIAALDTPQGIEDRAREQFGWVHSGEEAVNITGLSTKESTTVLPEAVQPGSVESEGDWWTQTLDEFFGVAPAQAPALEHDPIPGL